MSNRDTSIFPFHKLAEKIRNLDAVCRNLSEIMLRQLDAVIASDADKVLQLTEKNIDAQQDFQLAERAFIRELKNCLPEIPKGEKRITLEILKDSYPEYSIYIEEWQRQITGNISRLQKQQNRLMQLLEFAQTQNGAMMRSIYGLQNARNLRYRQDGEKESVSSGMAINQEG